MRRFEALLVKPVRFWEIGIEGTSVLTAWGTVGKGDRAEYEVTLASSEEAAAYVEREIGKQQRDGFVEIRRVAAAVEAPAGATAPTPTAPSQHDKAAPIRPRRVAKRVEHRDAALEAQCLAAPDDPAPWAIYADWLIARGSPLGEIAGLALGGNEQAAFELLYATYPELCVPDGMDLAIELHHGFARRLALTSRRGCDARLEDEIEPILLCPATRFVDALRFGVPCAADTDATWQPTIEKLVALDIATRLRELRCDAYDMTIQEISWQGFGDWSFAWPKLPRLEVLHVKSGKGGTLGELVLPSLRTFIRESGGLDRRELAAIANATWPALEHLEIWTGDANYGANTTVGDLQPIFAARGLPDLRHLGIVNSALVDDIVPELVRSRLLPQLHSLDLSKGIASAAFTSALVAHAPAFRHLASIDLSENQLSDDELARIRAVLDNVIVVDQRAIDDFDEDDDGNEVAVRYVAVGE